MHYFTYFTYFKQIILWSLVGYSTVGFSQSIELQLHSLIMKNQSVTENERLTIGGLKVKKVRFKNPLLGFFLMPQDGLEMDIVRSLHTIEILNEEMGASLTYDFSALSALQEIGLQALNLKVLPEVFSLSAQGANITYGQMHILARNFAATCGYLEQKDLDMQAIAPVCLNNLQLLPADEQEPLPLVLQIGETVNLVTNLSTLNLLENEVNLTGSNLDISFADGTDDFTAQVNHYGVTCAKPLLDSLELNGDDLLGTCLNQAKLDAPAIAFTSKSLDMVGVIETDELFTTEDALVYSGPQVKLELKKGTQKIDVKFIKMACQKPNFEPGMPFADIANQCLSSVSLNVGKVDYNDSESKTQVLIESETSATIDDQQLHLASSYIFAQIDDTKFHLRQNDITCARINNPEKLDPMELIEGCVNQSKIDIQQIKVENPTSQVDLQVKNISIDNHLIKLNVPHGSYILNTSNRSIENLDFSCQLDAKFDMVKEVVEKGDMGAFKENCFKKLNVKVSSLELPAPKGLINLIKFSKAQQLSFIATDGRFDLDLKLKITTGWLFDSSVKVKTSGTMVYEKATDSVILNFSSITVARIPMRKIITTLLEFFFHAEDLEVHQNSVKIRLSAEHKSWE